MAEAGIDGCTDGKQQGGRKTAEKQRTTHEVSLQMKRRGSDWGDRGMLFRSEDGMQPESFTQL